MTRSDAFYIQISQQVRHSNFITVETHLNDLKHLLTEKFIFPGFDISLNLGATSFVQSRLCSSHSVSSHITSQLCNEDGGELTHHNVAGCVLCRCGQSIGDAYGAFCVIGPLTDRLAVPGCLG